MIQHLTEGPFHLYIDGECRPANGGETFAVTNPEEPLARLITLEMGKPIREARGEVLSAAEITGWYAEEGKRVYGETISSHTPIKRLLVIKQPVGVA